MLGQSRDREVLEARLINAVRALPPEIDGAAALVVIQKHLDAELAEANSSIEAALGTPRYARTHGDAARRCRSPTHHAPG